MTISIGRKAGTTIGILTILAVVYNVIFFVVPWKIEASKAAFWITYGFTWFALLFAGLSTYLAFNKKELKSMIFGIPIFKVGVLVVFLQILVDIVVMCVGSFFEIWFWIPLIVELVIFAFASISLIARTANRDHIDHIDSQSYRESYIKELRIELETLANTNTIDSVKEKLNKLLELVRYTDPVSSREVVDVEDQISLKLDELKTAISEGREDDASKLIGEVSDLVKERKLRVKNFR